ncbi:MAG TPA: hypothetical protein VMV19_12475 [Xanthobacteraceae bacterium]|nr:hypothetical protein [Xanthobacteraceae bacterium]
MPSAETRPNARLPRHARETARIRRATAAARAQGMPAMAIALAEIETAFDDAAVVSSFKIRIERLLRLPPGHPTLRARYGARAMMLAGYDLNGATVAVERWWRKERKAFQIACALGGGTRLSLDVLGELRLVLRLMRRKRMQAEYDASLAALCEAPMRLAAE